MSVLVSDTPQPAGSDISLWEELLGEDLGGAESIVGKKSLRSRWLSKPKSKAKSRWIKGNDAHDERGRFASKDGGGIELLNSDHSQAENKNISDTYDMIRDMIPAVADKIPKVNVILSDKHSGGCYQFQNIYLDHTDVPQRVAVNFAHEFGHHLDRFDKASESKEFDTAFDESRKAAEEITIPEQTRNTVQANISHGQMEKMVAALTTGKVSGAEAHDTAYLKEGKHAKQEVFAIAFSNWVAYDPQVAKAFPSLFKFLEDRYSSKETTKSSRWLIPKFNQDQPRGQPGNAGQFASTGHAATATEESREESRVAGEMHHKLKEAIDAVKYATGFSDEKIREALTGNAGPDQKETVKARQAIESAILTSGTDIKNAVVGVLAAQDPTANHALIQKIGKGDIDRLKKELAGVPHYDLQILGGLNWKAEPVKGQANCKLATRVLTMGKGCPTGDARHELGHAILAYLDGTGGSNGIPIHAGTPMAKAAEIEYNAAMAKAKAEPQTVPTLGGKKIEGVLGHEHYETKFGVAGSRSFDSWHENAAEFYRLYHRELYRDKFEGGNGKCLEQFRERHPGWARIFDAHYTAAAIGQQLSGKSPAFTHGSDKPAHVIQQPNKPVKPAAAPVAVSKPIAPKPTQIKTDHQPLNEARAAVPSSTNATAKGWQDKAPEAASAVKDYVGGQAKTVNDALRHGTEPTGDTYKAVQAAIQEHGSKPEGTLYRGVQMPNYAAYTGLMKRFDQAQASGKEFSMRGIHSATLRPEVAEKYTHKTGEGTVLEISAKQALPVGGIGDSKAGDNEHLLAHGAKYKVVGIGKADYPKADGGTRKMKVVQLQEV